MSTRHFHLRCGLTLTEIMMATVIFAVVSVGVVEGITATTRFAVTTEKQDDIAKEAQRIFKFIGDDLATSGWEFPSFVKEDYTDVSNGLDVVEDRKRMYFPYVIQQSPQFKAAAGAFESPPLNQGLPLATPHETADTTMPGVDQFSFVHLRRDRSLVRLDLPDGLPGDAIDALTHFGSLPDLEPQEKRRKYVKSFYARSQELVFLKAASSEWAENTEDQYAEILDFAGSDADWETPNPGTVSSYYNERYDFYVTEKNKTASEAADLAHEDVRVAFYNHDAIGVLRMNDYQLNIKRDLNGDPVLGEGDSLQLEPHYRPSAPEGKQYVDNVVVPGAWISVDTNNEVNVKVRWETIVAEDKVDITSDISSAAERINLPQLREYLYAVVPSKGGAGRLVRAHAVQKEKGFKIEPVQYPGYDDIISFDPKSGRAMKVDEVISDDVARVTFDTYRTVTDGSLGINEVRVRIYMVIPDTDIDGANYTHVYENTLVMRTGNNERTIQDNKDVLRDVGVPFPY